MRRFSFLVIPLFMLAILFAGSLIIVFSIGFVSPPKSHSVIVVLKTMKSDIEFWVTARTGILTAAKEFGMNVEIVGPWDESDVEGQLQVMDQVLGKNPEAIILVASDFHALAPSVEAAAAQGITVLTLDSAVDSDIPLCFVATNNVEAGEKAGSVMADRLEPGKAVAIVGHVKGAATAIDRELGVRRGLAGRTVAGTYFCENFSDRAYLITKEIMEAYPDLGGIVALNEVSTMGVARAIRDLNLKGRVKVVGFDHSIAEIKLIEDGIIDATVVQKPFNMGYLAVKKTYEALQGRRPERFIDTGSVLITVENIYTPENQKLLFPFPEKQRRIY